MSAPIPTFVPLSRFGLRRVFQLGRIAWLPPTHVAPGRRCAVGKQIRITAPTTEGAILRLLDVCNPGDIATAVDLFIERLDQMAGDPDLEPDGDELDGSFAEDDFCSHNLAYPGPGCPVSDGGCPTGSGAGDPAWAEWHTRGRHKVGKFGEEQCRRLDGINMAKEDDEEDDPREADGDESDGNGSEEDFMRHDWDGPGCPVADAGEHDDEGAGQCMTFGVDQTERVGAIAAFHDLNGILLIRVPHPANDQVPA